MMPFILELSTDSSILVKNLFEQTLGFLWMLRGLLILSSHIHTAVLKHMAPAKKKKKTQNKNKQIHERLEDTISTVLQIIYFFDSYSHWETDLIIQNVSINRKIFGVPFSKTGPNLTHMYKYIASFFFFPPFPNTFLDGLRLTTTWGCLRWTLYLLLVGVGVCLSLV